MFIVLLRYVKPLEEVERLLEAHRRWLATLRDAGHLVMSGPRRPRTGGVLLSPAGTATELWGLLDSDPFRLGGMAEYELIEFEPTLTASGLHLPGGDP